MSAGKTAVCLTALVIVLVAGCGSSRLTHSITIGSGRISVTISDGRSGKHVVEFLLYDARRQVVGESDSLNDGSGGGGTYALRQPLPAGHYTYAIYDIAGTSTPPPVTGTGRRIDYGSFNVP